MELAAVCRIEPCCPAGGWDARWDPPPTGLGLWSCRRRHPAWRDSDRAWPRGVWTTRCSARTALPQCSGHRRAPLRSRWRHSSADCGTGLRRSSNATGRDDIERAGGAAAGGTGFAASALLNAEIDSGIELILDLIDFDRRIAGADLVVTGEGSLDEQSLEGKAPVGVAVAAGRAGIPVVAVAGRLQLSPPRLQEAGITAAYALADLEPDLRRSIANASPLLRRIGAQIAKEWLR